MISPSDRDRAIFSLAIDDDDETLINKETIFAFQDEILFYIFDFRTLKIGKTKVKMAKKILDILENNLEMLEIFEFEKYAINIILNGVKNDSKIEIPVELIWKAESNYERYIREIYTN